jgi:hypothetical protein
LPFVTHSLTHSLTHSSSLTLSLSLWPAGIYQPRIVVSPTSTTQPRWRRCPSKRSRIPTCSCRNPIPRGGFAHESCFAPNCVGFYMHHDFDKPQNQVRQWPQRETSHVEQRELAQESLPLFGKELFPLVSATTKNMCTELLLLCVCVCVCVCDVAWCAYFTSVLHTRTIA